MNLKRSIGFCLSLALIFATACLAFAVGQKESAKPAAGAAAAAGTTIKNGGKVTIAMALNPKILGYPAEVTNNGPLPFLDPLMESLASFNGKGELVPWLAESWSTDAAAKTITFKLRKGVKFQDGTDFNADAVIWNLQRYIENKRSETNTIESMTAVDDATVRITLTAWNSSSVNAIGYFVRYISPTAFKAHNKEWCYANPVGTGPFLLDKWDINVSVKYKKNPNYWQPGKPHLDAVEMLTIDNTMTGSNALLAGEIDCWVSTDYTVAKNLIASGKFNVTYHKNGIGAVGVGLIPDCSPPDSPWRDVRVRKAMCFSIDTQKLVDTFTLGFSVVTNQWGSPDAYTYNPEVVGYPYNPAKARQLLADAGYPGGFKTKLWAGVAYKDMFTAIQAYLAAVGINAELLVVDEAKIQSLYFNTWEGGLMGHFHSVQPDLGLYMYRHLDPNGAFYAKGIFHPADVLDLLKENQQAPSFQVKKDTSMKIQKLVYDEYCLVGKPLYIPVGIFFKQKYVRDDGYMVTSLDHWTPQDAWVDK